MGFDWIAPKNYKRHYICLKCQKGFKRPSKEDMKHPKSTDFSNLMNEYYDSDRKQDIIKYIEIRFQKLKVICPNCQNNMLQVHYNFETPSQRDNKSWKSLQKTLSSKTVIPYDTYIEWHRLELQKVVVNSAEHSLLKQNLAKLKNI